MERRWPAGAQSCRCSAPPAGRRCCCCRQRRCQLTLASQIGSCSGPVLQQQQPVRLWCCDVFDFMTRNQKGLYSLTAMSELANLCFSLDEVSLCLRESFFSGLLLSSDLFCHWLFITCCRRRPIQTSERQVDIFNQQLSWMLEVCHL